MKQQWFLLERHSQILMLKRLYVLRSLRIVFAPQIPHELCGREEEICWLRRSCFGWRNWGENICHRKDSSCSLEFLGYPHLHSWSFFSQGIYLEPISQFAQFCNLKVPYLYWGQILSLSIEENNDHLLALLACCLWRRYEWNCQSWGTLRPRSARHCISSGNFHQTRYRCYLSD